MQKRKPLTNAEKLEQRIAELDVIQQMEVHYAAERAERQKEQDAFMLKVQQNRDARAAALARGEELEAPIIPTIAELYAQKRAEEEAEAERLEAERISQLNPRDVWLSTRPLSERQHIAKWEGINRMAYPVPMGSSVES
jgi:hypothetical protein